MPDEQIVAYVRAQMGKGVGHADISKALIASGWSVEAINTALTSLHAPVNEPVSIASSDSVTFPGGATSSAPAPVSVPSSPAPLKATKSAVPTGLVAGGIATLFILGGIGWWILHLPKTTSMPNDTNGGLEITDTPSTVGAEEWEIPVTGEMKEYRNEELGFGFKVPENVRVNEKSLGKYASYEFWVPHARSVGATLSRQGIATLIVNSDQTVETLLSANSKTFEFAEEDSSVGGVAASKHVLKFRDIDMTALVAFSQGGNQYIFQPGYGSNPDDNDLYKAILGSIVFFPAQNTHPSLTLEEFRSSIALDAMFSSLINKAAVHASIHSGQGNPERGYGAPSNDCFASEGMFADPRVRDAMTQLKEAGAQEITCFVSPEGFAISVRRPESTAKEGLYKCQDNNSGTTGQCGINVQITGPDCGQCVDPCNSGPEDIIC